MRCDKAVAVHSVASHGWQTERPGLHIAACTHCTQALFLEFMNAHNRDRTADGAVAAVLSARLKLIGGCRNAGDEARVAALRREAAGLDIADSVDFHVNASWDEVTATGRSPSRYELDLSNVLFAQLSCQTVG